MSHRRNRVVSCAYLRSYRSAGYHLSLANTQRHGVFVIVEHLQRRGDAVVSHPGQSEGAQHLRLVERDIRSRVPGTWNGYGGEQAARAQGVGVAVVGVGVGVGVNVAVGVGVNVAVGVGVNVAVGVGVNVAVGVGVNVAVGVGVNVAVGVGVNVAVAVGVGVGVTASHSTNWAPSLIVKLKMGSNTVVS